MWILERGMDSAGYLRRKAPSRMFSAVGKTVWQRFEHVWVPTGTILGIIVAAVSATHHVERRFHEQQVANMQTKVELYEYLLKITNTQDYKPLLDKLQDQKVKGEGKQDEVKAK